MTNRFSFMVFEENVVGAVQAVVRLILLFVAVAVGAAVAVKAAVSWS